MNLEQQAKFVAIKKLDKDLIDAMEITTMKEARFLVNSYYIMQEDRIRAYGQGRELFKTGNPHKVISFLAGQSEGLEDQIKKALDRYTDTHPIAQWLKTHIGIGSVISAGIVSNLDITKAPTAGHFFSYAGLCPEQKRVKGRKVNWNPDLKRILWLCGECFVKVSGNDNAYFGKMYRQRKEYEQAKNEAGDYKDQALAKAAIVGKGTDAYPWYSGFWVIDPELNPTAIIDSDIVENIKKIKKDVARNFDANLIKNKKDAKELLNAEKMVAVEAYLADKQITLRPMLPPAHIQRRVTRYTTKMLLSFLHEVWYWHEYKKAPPAPYAMVFAGHAHKLEIPNKPLFVGI